MARDPTQVTPRRSTAARCTEVLEALADGPLTERQIAERIGVAPGSALRLVRMLARDGRIRVAGVLDRELRGPKPILYGLAQ